MTLNKKCKLCNYTLNLVEHHPDYSKPNETFTLCRSCHWNLHSFLKKHNLNPDTEGYYIYRNHLCSSKSTKKLIMDDCIKKLLIKKPFYDGMFITSDIILKEIGLFYINKKWLA